MLKVTYFFPPAKTRKYFDSRKFSVCIFDIYVIFIKQEIFFDKIHYLFWWLRKNIVLLQKKY